MAPETEPQQGKETVLRFLKALTEIEPQINASGQLRYVISGSAAIFLYEHGKDISYIELTDGTGRPTEDYKEVSADRPIEKVFEPIPLDVEDREALSIRPPFRRLPSDIDIIPITDDMKLPDEVRPLSHDPLTDKVISKLRNQTTLSVDRNLQSVNGKLAVIVRITLELENKAFDLYIDSPEAIIEGKLKVQLSRSTERKQNQFTETEETIKWGLRAFGYTWVLEMFDRAVSPILSPYADTLPIHSDEFSRTLTGQLFVKALESYPLFRQIRHIVNSLRVADSKLETKGNELLDSSVKLIRAYELNDHKEFIDLEDLLTPERMNKSEFIVEELTFFLQQIQKLSGRQVRQAISIWKRIYDLDSEKVDHVTTPGLPWISNGEMIEQVSNLLDLVDRESITSDHFLSIINSLSENFHLRRSILFNPVPVGQPRRPDKISDHRAAYFQGLSTLISNNVRMNRIDKLPELIREYNSQYTVG